MFEYLLLEDFGHFSRLEWQDHRAVNIIIGENDTGKSYILKALYSIAKSLEEYTKRGATDQRAWKDILSEKMFWVYQPDKGLGDLVRKDGDRLHVTAKLRSQTSIETYDFEFGKSTKQKITKATNEVYKQLDLGALYIPTKEVLTAFDAIAAVNEQLKMFGFDQTYQDLIQALRIPNSRKELEEEFQKVLDSLNEVFRGEILMERKRFVFKRGQDRYTMSQTAEGIKKISILTTLIRNRTLQKGTILFLDEPETNLHPRAIIAFCEMLFNLSQVGIQIYMATHSYFVIKQFELLARRHEANIQLCCLSREEGVCASFSDLQEGMPSNPIVDASIKLYEEDVRLTLGQ